MEYNIVCIVYFTLITQRKWSLFAGNLIFRIAVYIDCKYIFTDRRERERERIKNRRKKMKKRNHKAIEVTKEFLS